MSHRAALGARYILQHHPTPG